MQFKAANAQSTAPATAQNAAVSANKLVPTANPFSKKRQHSEITKAEDPLASRNGRNGNSAVVDEANDIAMQDDFKSAAASDVKMQSAAESSHEAHSAVKGLDQHKSNAHLPNATSNIEEDWRRLKQQNSELNSEIRTVDATQALNSQDLPLAMNPDGTLSFFWTDAHEEQFGTDFFLFGKVWQP